eukprot:2949527-Prymnesium_polylepis.1
MQAEAGDTRQSAEGDIRGGALRTIESRWFAPSTLEHSLRWNTLYVGPEPVSGCSGDAGRRLRRLSGRGGAQLLVRGID